MSSETSSLLDWIIAGAGVVVIGQAVFAMAVGRFKLARTYTVTRDEAPRAFWGWVAGFVALGVSVILVSLPRLGG